MFLEIQGLKVSYRSYAGTITVLDDFYLNMKEGETVAIVGESGSGKSTLGQAITKLLPPSAVMDGKIEVSGIDISKKSEDEMSNIRGTTMFMIFQNPLNSLNPVKTVGFQLMEAISIRNQRNGENMTEEQMKNEVVETMKVVRLPDPERILERYPHELSGGQVQRVVICMALLLKPRLLIADEPTTALDVTIQAQVVNLLKELNQTRKMSIIFITHDLSLAYVLADRIVVMYAGRIMEDGPAEDLIRKPLHPYTEGLLMSIPTNDKNAGPLYSIPGSPPSFFSLPKGCKFSPRCRYVFGKCETEEPRLVNYGSSSVRCWLRG
ncbi:ABC transporter ATP-binding protein [Thermogymnomonas acidicola]|uniref:ABC transporter ATP-binding protein n=2 Tax=Thermogymnomonas acidicola TaxID=399579 RepID=A0AA37F8Y0_9ARCH|nr:ABC transporter ATP-binding protein [Thermogymnomonas acidicola]GGM67749.1 ABC transporter ATP-binding protein [Thermogymnomonas acidicola]